MQKASAACVCECSVLQRVAVRMHSTNANGFCRLRSFGCSAGPRGAVWCNEDKFDVCKRFRLLAYVRGWPGVCVCLCLYVQARERGTIGDEKVELGAHFADFGVRVRLCVCLCVYVRVCLHVYMYKSIYIYTFIY